MKPESFTRRAANLHECRSEGASIRDKSFTDLDLDRRRSGPDLFRMRMTTASMRVTGISEAGSGGRESDPPTARMTPSDVIKNRFEPLSCGFKPCACRFEPYACRFEPFSWGFPPAFVRVAASSRAGHDLRSRRLDPLSCRLPPALVRVAYRVRDAATRIHDSRDLLS